MKKLFAVLALLFVPLLADTGLLFPGNEATTSTRFNFTGTLPNFYPFSAVWKFSPFQNTGYYTIFFRARNDGSTFGCPDYDDFYGAHPYPFGGAGGTIHNFEIATNCDDDTTDDGGHHPPRVTKGTLASPIWYDQGITVRNSTGSTLEVKYYYNLPDTTYVIINTTANNITDGSTPGIIFGDAPWSASNEQLSGILRHIKLFSTNLSGTELKAEVASESNAGVTAAGIANLWYSNINPTPSDIADKSGAGHNPAWVGSLKAEIWPRPTPTPTILSSVEAVSEVSSTTLETASFACTGANRAIYVLTGSTDGTPVAASAARWGGSGGTSMTQIGTNISTEYGRYNVWRLVAPTSQTSTVHVTWGSSAGERSVIAACLNGVDQATPETIAQTTGSGTAMSHSVASTTTDLVLGLPVYSQPCDARTFALSTADGYAEHQQTSVQKLDGSDAGGCHGIALLEEAANEPNTVSSGLLSASAQWGYFVVSVNGAEAAPAGGSGGRRALLGVGN